MRIINWVTAAAIGIVITAAVSGLPLMWPALAIGIGATVTGLVLVARRGGRKYYAAAGTAFCIGLAAAIYISGYFPDGYNESPYGALLGLGVVSAVIVGMQTVGRLLVKRIFGGAAGEEYATAIYDMVTAIVGLLGMVWTVLTAYEKALRYGGIGIGGTAGLVLNLAGIELPIPWFIQGGVDASLVLVVGCVLIAFHSLESIHTTWYVTKASANVGVSAGKAASAKAYAAASGSRGPDE